MSQKQTKKYRKEVRKMVDGKIEDGMAALRQMVRERPEWIPKRLWILLYLPLFKRRYLRLIYKHIP